MSTRKILTDKEYLAKSGTICPVCKGDNIEGSSIEVSCNYAFQEITCNDCYSSWVDHYELMGYDELTIGDGE